MKCIRNLFWTILDNSGHGSGHSGHGSGQCGQLMDNTG